MHWAPRVGNAGRHVPEGKVQLLGKFPQWLAERARVQE